MNRKIASICSLSGLGLIAILTLGNVSSSLDEGQLFCKCEPNIAFNHTLPLSHPINKCAATQSDAVSWSSWIKGSSSSYQFHFIDLLELLSRTKDYTTEDYTDRK
ncbi:hypothetical protein RS130_01630 [Paraglaciecola aquimarina]|uniref:Uncharacterized protein n=1 Tax=Paraglaciecola aquimarina TaxID=1235557 RepID=A0ABU3SS01_9ALTE|nr:hypothetical protein [Paraglaciecola aquimarina]MDU0352796.1 hypothetical protein [Paraglaciecola aquimarina]